MKKVTASEVNASLEYLIAYGICESLGDLLYKQLANGNYIVAWKSCQDVDVFLCKCLPRSSEEIGSTNIIRKISSFDSKNSEKVKEFRENIMPR